MNARGARPKQTLGLCPRCHMDSGKRMTEEGSKEKYFVICETCGYIVGPYKTGGAAVKIWNMESRYHV